MNRKEKLFRQILDQSVSDKLPSLLGINTDNCLRECELLDYKETYSDTKPALAKTVKQIVSFFNTYGGFLLYGVKEISRDAVFQTTGKGIEIELPKLRGAIDKYTGTNIPISLHDIEVLTEDGPHKIIVIAIPRRDNTSPVHFITDANDLKNRVIFRRNETPIRDGDRSRTALNGDDFEILFSSRTYPSQGFLNTSEPKPIKQHNLPDKNLICPTFIGRSEIIAQLWSWLADDFEYIKVLAGEGGRGKTSIAYEFSTQVVRNIIVDYDMVLWLTAKERQFNALADHYVDLPEVHFHSAESLVQRVIAEFGAGDNEQGDSMPALKRAAIQALEVIPTLLVVDNLDSMDMEEQRRVIETVRQIANRCHGRSRVLLTTRNNVSMPIEQCIEVPGLQGKEYEDFVIELCNSYQVELPNSKIRKQLHGVSDGSPLFIQSILRLVRLGQSPVSALADWAKQGGLNVRSAALRREVEQLTTESRRVLYALALVRSASYEELKQIARYEDHTLRDTLDQLSSLFLIHAQKIIETERRFEIPESTARLIVDLKESLVTRPEEINARITAIYKNAGKAQKEVGEAIRQSLALLNVGDFDKAIQTVEALIRKPKYSENADLLLLKGRVQLEAGNTDSARIEFKRAYDSGARKELLFVLWANAERDSRHYQGMYDVCEYALARGSHVDDLWIYRRAEACVGIASQTGDFGLKLIQLRKAASDLARLIHTSTNAQRSRFVADSMGVHDLIWHLCEVAGDWPRAFGEMFDCINRRDFRGVVFHRAIDSIDKMLADAKEKGAKAEIDRIEKRLIALQERAYERSQELGISEITPAEERIEKMLSNFPFVP